MIYICTAMKNTVELMNSNDETVLKVCFDTPLAHAGMNADNSNNNNAVFSCF